MEDQYSSYEHGIAHIKEYLGTQEIPKESYEEFLTFEARLWRCIKAARLYGSGTNRNSDLAEILSRLNAWSIQHTSKSFNEWSACEAVSSDLLQPVVLKSLHHPVSSYLRDLYLALQKVSTIFKRPLLYPFDCDEIERVLYQATAKFTRNVLDEIVACNPPQLVNLCHIKQEVEGILGLIQAFRGICHTHSGPAMKQRVQQKLRQVLSEMEEALPFLSQQDSR